ncbi:endo alpha-1,4 polygalactosaminidase [Herbiconiux sp. P18]|uniref:endo alpha-1,4 polygalactosaminidase n=1 Tax=Herbiconiux liangxiaofengii TaxID=3342795 RepID=UPI0035BAD0FD
MVAAFRRRVSLAAVAVLTMLALAACAAPAESDAGGDTAASGSVSPTPSVTPTPTEAPAPVAPVIRPIPAGAVVDYQLGGAYEPAAAVTVVARDSDDAPVPGLYNICYVNGFQTQPESNWPEVLVLHDAKGKPVTDPGWPDESILDISTPDNRAAIADRIAVTIAGCAGSGFDAVEFDNLDSYTRSRGAFGLDEAMQLAHLLVDVAHANGLAAGQKNTPELAARGHAELGFDFAVAEECQRFQECASYTSVYGDQVVDIEYSGHLRGTWAEVCADPTRPAAMVLRDRELAPLGTRGHVYDSC